MADEFEYLLQARSEFRHGDRHVYLSEVVRPVVYGVQGKLGEHYHRFDSSVQWLVCKERTMDLRTLQRPLKDRYRQDATTAQFTLRADGGQTDSPLACSVDLGRAIY